MVRQYKNAGNTSGNSIWHFQSDCIQYLLCFSLQSSTAKSNIIKGEDTFCCWFLSNYNNRTRNKTLEVPSLHKHVTQPEAIHMGMGQYNLQ